MGRYRNVSILAAAIFLQVVGLAVQIKRHTADDSTRLIRVWTVSAIAPFEKVIVRLQSGSGGIWHNYVYLRGVRQQNRDLQQQIQQMQLEQVRLRQDAEQARRLQTLLGFKEQFINKTVAAQVIGSSGSEQSRLVYIDKGSDDGIKTDMAVITASGVVGKVFNVINGGTSQVLLINDQNSGVGTILEQSRLQGVLKGKASGQLALDKVMAEEEVKLGDRVLTSGGDLIFPKGLPVGTVDKINRGTEFVQVIVRPSASLNHLEEVLVITQKLEREPAVASGAQVRAADILAQRLPSVPDTPAAGQGAVSESDNTAKPALKPQNEAAKAATGATQPAANLANTAAKPQTSQPVSEQKVAATVPKPKSASTQAGTQVLSGTTSTAPSPTKLVPASVGIKPAAPSAPPVTSNAVSQKPAAMSNAPGIAPKKNLATSPAANTAANPAKSLPAKPTPAAASKPGAGTSTTQPNPNGDPAQ